jgi:hypothetical protein
LRAEPGEARCGGGSRVIPGLIVLLLVSAGCGSAKSDSRAAIRKAIVADLGTETVGAGTKVGKIRISSRDDRYAAAEGWRVDSDGRQVSKSAEYFLKRDGSGWRVLGAGTDPPARCEQAPTSVLEELFGACIRMIGGEAMRRDLGG